MDDPLVALAVATCVHPGRVEALTFEGGYLYVHLHSGRRLGIFTNQPDADGPRIIQDARALLWPKAD